MPKTHRALKKSDFQRRIQGKVARGARLSSISKFYLWLKLFYYKKLKKWRGGGEGGRWPMIIHLMVLKTMLITQGCLKSAWVALAHISVGESIRFIASRKANFWILPQMAPQFLLGNSSLLSHVSRGKKHKITLSSLSQRMVTQDNPSSAISKLNGLVAGSGQSPTDRFTWSVLKSRLFLDLKSRPIIWPGISLNRLLALSLPFLFLVAMAAAPTQLPAETISFSLFQGMTNNLYQNYLGVSDMISRLSLEADKNIGSFSLFTQGDLSYVLENSDLTYYTHLVGADYLWPVGEKSALYLGVLGRGAFYRQSYTDFNYLALQGRVSFKSYLNPSSILQIDSLAEVRDYAGSIYDHFNSSVEITLDKYWSSRTTLKTGLFWGWKAYRHPFLPSAEDAYTSSSFSLMGGMGGGSPWRNSSGKGYHHGSPKGYTGMTDYAQPGGEGAGQSIQVAALSLLVAQGLGERVGLRVTATQQWNIAGENPFRTLDEYYLVENPTYDRFAWSGRIISGLLTVVAPWNIEGKIGYTVSWKNFPGIESYDLEGNPLGVEREDKRYEMAARLEKNFRQVSLYLSLVLVSHHSNDPYFDWQGYFISGGLSWNFFVGRKE